MIIDDTKIKKILKDGSYVSEEDLEKAEIFAKRQRVTLQEALFSLGSVTGDLIGQAMAESLGVLYADLNSHMPVKEQVLRLNEQFARSRRVVIFAEEAKKITIATDEPLKKGLPKDLEGVLGKKKKIVIAYSLSEDIEAVFSLYRKSLETRFSKIIKKGGKVIPELLNEIFEDALSFRASDIHFEPKEKEVAIRFRVDGILHEAGRIPKEFYENILNRIKVGAHLRIDEHFSAQDGALRYLARENDAVTDIRVSIIPNLEGEKVVMRMLSSYVRSFTLGDLGLSAENQQLLLNAGKKPFGMILVTGPTGSGKTTTLYALLKLLSCPEVNVMTIEDPVEYRMESINQIQVNTQTNLTFAYGLRSIVRQDPDIILVGEIRDEETAEIAVNAALTGHLLLSTFHANDAASSIPRLLDMGVEPFLLSSTLELIIAQRLVRKICENCRYSYTEKGAELKKLFPEADMFFGDGSQTLYHGKGCESCNGTGFKGRTSIFEFIAADREMKDLILKIPSTQDIARIARKNGAKALFEDGIEKVKKGITTIEELLRVASPASIYETKKQKNKK